MVQMMPVLRAVVGTESMSNRHMCSRKVSAIAALSCWVWMKAEPMSDFGWGIVLEDTVVLQKKKVINEMQRADFCSRAFNKEFEDISEAQALIKS